MHPAVPYQRGFRPSNPPGDAWMSNATTADLIVLGSYVQDHIWLCDRFPVPGETRRATGFYTGPGGKGFNQAVAAHRQGVRTLFIGAIGNDTLGRNAQSFAREIGLTSRWLTVTDQPTAASSIVVDGDGRNQIVVSLGANAHIPPNEVPGLLESATENTWLLLQLENNLDAIAAAVEFARGRGCRIALNPAPVHEALDPALLARLDLLTPNESELALLLHKVTGTQLAADQVAALSDDALHAYSRMLGVPTVVVTLGEQGCFVSHGNGSGLRGGDPDRYRITAESVNAVDSTGAGDAFNGALLAAMLRDADGTFRGHAEHANRSAALSTETVGTAPAMPTLDQVAHRFDGSQ